MKEILLVYKKLKENTTAQAYIFAIHTSQYSNPKLQKIMLLSNARAEIETKKLTLQIELKDKKDRWQKR